MTYQFRISLYSTKRFKFRLGLFRGGIAESGSGISNWAIQLKPEIYAREMFNKITKRTTNSSNEILKVLQETPASEIHKFSAEMTIEVLRKIF